MFPLAHAGLTLLAWRSLWGRWTPGLWGSPAVVLAAALLPDLVDKPLALLADGFGGGRAVGHTLAFVLGLAFSAYVLSRRGRHRAAEGLGILAFGSGLHLVLDRAYMAPRVFWWPLLGVGFPPGEIEAAAWYRRLLGDPWTYGPEIAGGLVLAWEGWRWVRARRGTAGLQAGEPASRE